MEKNFKQIVLNIRFATGAINRVIFALIAAVVFATGCTHLQSVSTSSIPEQRSKPVKAEGYRFIFLGFNFNNDYVNEMTENLAGKCPDGQIKGILTKFENIIYFPVFAHAVRVEAQGYCVGAGS